MFVASKLIGVNSINFQGNFCWWWQLSPKGGARPWQGNPPLLISSITLPIACDQQDILQVCII